MIFEIICTRTYDLTIVTEHESRLNYPDPDRDESITMRIPISRLKNIRSFAVSRFDLIYVRILRRKARGQSILSDGEDDFECE